MSRIDSIEILWLNRVSCWYLWRLLQCFELLDCIIYNAASKYMAGFVDLGKKDIVDLLKLLIL